MFGLGGQEVAILLCCGTVPVLALGIAFAVGRLSARNAARDDSGATMNYDDPNYS